MLIIVILGNNKLIILNSVLYMGKLIVDDNFCLLDKSSDMIKICEHSNLTFIISCMTFV